MDLIELLKAIKKKIWLILIMTILFTAAGAIYSKYMVTPVYEAKSRLIVTRVTYNLDERLDYSDILMYQMLVKTYGELANSKPVLAETISRLGVDMSPAELQGSLTVTAQDDTQIIEIRVQNTNPQRACDLTNALSEVFIEKAREMMNTDDVKVMEQAEVPMGFVSPNINMNITITFMLGITLSIALIFLLDYFDNTLKTEGDIEKCLAMTVLASIPYETKKKRYR